MPKSPSPKSTNATPSAFSPKRLENKEATGHFTQKALLPNASHYDVLAYEHALAFTVAGMMEQDLLQDTYRLMQQAIKDGVSFNDFKKQLKPQLIKKGWLAKDFATADGSLDKAAQKSYDKYLGRRLKTIYHTNKQTAYAAGRWQRIQNSKEGLPYLQYMPSLSTHQRDEHKRYYGLVRPVDDPIWASIFPPNSFGCKCWVKQLSTRQAQKIGISEPITLETDTVQNPHTGEMIETTKGVHFSFNHNHDRLSALLKLAEGKHGTVFAKALADKLPSYMVDYAKGQGMGVVDFGGLTPRVSEIGRLELELDGRKSPTEAKVADEWQQKFAVKLERFDPALHKILSYNPSTNAPKSADFAIVNSATDSKNWITIDFLFTMDKKQAQDMAYQIFESKKKRHTNAWDRVVKTIDEHLLKADVVPMDIRTLDARIATKVVAYVLSLPKDKQQKILLITGEPDE